LKNASYLVLLLKLVFLVQRLSMWCSSAVAASDQREPVLEAHLDTSESMVV